MYQLPETKPRKKPKAPYRKPDAVKHLEQLLYEDDCRRHPANQTVYGWVNDRKVPHEKHGKRLYFRKSTIDTWLSNGRQMTAIVKPLR
jgi:hypothetical protein